MFIVVSKFFEQNPLGLNIGDVLRSLAWAAGALLIFFWIRTTTSRWRS